MTTEYIHNFLLYLHKNAWTIILILFIGYFCKIYFVDPFLSEYQAKQSYKDATNPDRVAVLTPDMRRVRAQQQEIAMQRVIDAAEEKKKKMAEEKLRKRVKSPEEERWERLRGEGNRLGEEEERDVKVGGKGAVGGGSTKK